MGKRPPSVALGPSKPQITARYELADDGVGWAIHILTEGGEFLASADRLQDVELRACQTIRAVLGLDAAAYDLDLVHMLNLEPPARVS